MTSLQTISVPLHLIENLRRDLHGRVVQPDDADWEPERRGWNLFVDQRPSLVVHAADVADIVATVRFAREHRLSVATQPVGHGATTALDGAILLRPNALDEIAIDIAARTARVGPGVRWWQLNAALSDTGLTSLPGSSGDPSVIGYTLGGGLSWFGRKYGLASNRVRAVELVTPDGERARVTGSTDHDLFWALRGGGGDFGIVTAIEIDLLPAAHVYGGRLAWSAEHAVDVLTAYTELTRAAPEDLSLWGWLLNLPDQEFVPPQLRGRWITAIDLTFLGGTSDARRHLSRLGDLPRPVLDTRGTVPIANLTDICAEPTMPMPLVDDATMLTRFDAEDVESLIDGVEPDRPSPLVVVGVRDLGGAMSRAPACAGAIASIGHPKCSLPAASRPAPPWPRRSGRASDGCARRSSRSTAGAVRSTSAAMRL